MKAKLGTVLMILGALMVLAAVGLFVLNLREQTSAAESVQMLMPQIVDAIQQRQTEPEETEPATTEPAQPTEPEGTDDPTPSQPVILPQPENKAFPVVEIDGYGYIGFLTIPSLELELPVMADWSYAQLKIAPCRYTGEGDSNDLVIMAHNYDRHFGRISGLHPGDTVAFTDMNGVTVYYEVVALDILAPSAVEEMTAGEYDLTLFTCTYGGKTRVTVRCDRVEE